MTVYVYSTLSCPQRYVKWTEAAPGSVPREERAILIQGGANVANRNLITPRGVVTEITDEEYALLKQNPLFNTHVTNGHIAVEERKADVDKVVSGMESRSPDAPLTPGDFDVSGTHETEGVTVKAKKRK